MTQRLLQMWLDTQAVLAEKRTLIICTFGVVAPAFLALSLRAVIEPNVRTWLWVWSPLYLIAQTVLILTGIAPPRYAKITLLETILPSIHRVLQLGENDRITIHHLRDKKYRTYEQLTNYHPTRVGRGRVFSFTHGIVGQCFATPGRAHSYAIPSGVAFVTAMQNDWSFTQDEISHLSQDRQSFFGFPIGTDGEYAKAVLYMDSPDPNTFNQQREAAITEQIDCLFSAQLAQILTW